LQACDRGLTEGLEGKAVTEAKWLACTDPQPMLHALAAGADDRRLRLLAIACCRRAWHLLPDGPFPQLLDAAEAFCEGAITADRMGLLLKTAEADYYREPGRGPSSDSLRQLAPCVGASRIGRGSDPALSASPDCAQVGFRLPRLPNRPELVSWVTQNGLVRHPG
jgi:hypothetical protein